MRRLINAFAIQESLIDFLLVGECSCLCVATVYVRLFIVSFGTINEKKACFILFIDNVQVSIITTNKT